MNEYRGYDLNPRLCHTCWHLLVVCGEQQAGSLSLADVSRWEGHYINPLWGNL